MPLVPATAAQRWRGRARAALAVAASLGLLVAPAEPAGALFVASALGAGRTSAQSIPAGSTPLASAVGSNVTVTWEETLLSGGTPASGYTVRRYSAAGAEAVVGAACSATVSGTSCVESGVPNGSWRYTVTPWRGTWTGGESLRSGAVAVSPASLTFSSPTTITSLPTTLEGTVAGFNAGVGITFRLDDPTGPVLSGTPSAVDASGQAAITVTIPAGTSDEPHSVFVVGANGRVASASINVVDPPGLATLRMLDADSDGRVDRVTATFDEPLAPYTAGVAPWTLANVPSGGVLDTVTVSGAVATLEITEGAGAPTTAVGAFTVALAANAAGVRDANNHRASFPATAPADAAPPARTSLVLADADADARVDRVTVGFSEALAAYSAGNAPWTLANVPSAGSLASVAVSGTTATLTVTEGAGAQDTAVGTVTVALAASATGVRDAAGNQASFGAATPADGARPIRTALQLFDGDVDGRVDRVEATFSEALAAYSAGTAPWTVTSVPSAGSLASVGVSGSVATLALHEGAGTPSTAVGSMRVVLASNAAGIRDAAGNLASFASVAPTDRAAPVLRDLNLLDATGNGKVDRVTALFSESLAAYTAGATPWTLANVPSGGTIGTVTTSTATATVNITEGSGAIDTTVGSMTVALAPSATGVRDAAGNQGTFAARAPADKAGPRWVSVTDTAGSTNGLAQSGDTLVITFSEALAAGSVPASTTITFADPAGTGNDTLTIAGITNGARSTGTNVHVGTDGTSAAFPGTVVLSGGNTITVTVDGPCSGSGCASLAANGTNANFSFGAAATLLDAFANAVSTASGAAASVSTRLF